MNKMIIGTFGSGKTYQLIPTLKAWKGSLLVFESHGEYSNALKDSLKVSPDILSQYVKYSEIMNALTLGISVFIEAGDYISPSPYISAEQIDYLFYRLYNESYVFTSENPLLIVIDNISSNGVYTALPLLIKIANKNGITLIGTIQEEDKETAMQYLVKLGYTSTQVNNIMCNCEIDIVENWHN